MSDGPRVIASDGQFRLVQIVDGARTSYLLEKRDGSDALGVERWKDVSLGNANTLTTQLRDWIIEHAKSCSHMQEGL